jgi:hypothetical protein
MVAPKLFAINRQSELMALEILPKSPRDVFLLFFAIIKNRMAIENAD